MNKNIHNKSLPKFNINQYKNQYKQALNHQYQNHFKNNTIENINKISHISTTSFTNLNSLTPKSTTFNPKYYQYYQQQMLLNTLSQKINTLRTTIDKFQPLKQYHHQLIRDYNSSYQQHHLFQNDIHILYQNMKNAIKELIKQQQKSLNQIRTYNQSHIIVQEERQLLKKRCQSLLNQILSLQDAQKALLEKSQSIKQQSKPILSSIKQQGQKIDQLMDSIKNLKSKLQNVDNHCNSQQSTNNSLKNQGNHQKIQLDRANLKHQQVLEDLKNLSNRIDDNQSLIQRKILRNNQVLLENSQREKQISALSKAIQNKQQSTRLQQQKFITLREDETQMEFQLKQLEKQLQHQRLGYKRDIQFHLKQLQRKQQNVIALEKLSEHLKSLIWTNCKLQQELNNNVIGDFQMVYHLGKTKGKRQEKAFDQWCRRKSQNKKKSPSLNKIHQRQRSLLQNANILRQNSMNLLREKSVNKLNKSQTQKSDLKLMMNSKYSKDGTIYDQIRMHEDQKSNIRNSRQLQESINDQNKLNSKMISQFKQSMSYSTRASPFIF